MSHLSFQINTDSLLNANGFEQLDTSKYLTTGILWDRTIPYLNFTEYGGFTDSRALNNRDLGQLYLDLKGATVNDSLPSLDSIMKRADHLSIAYDALPIMFFNINYQSIKNSALNDSLIIINNGQLTISQNADPFDSKQLVAPAAARLHRVCNAIEGYKA